MILSVFLLNLNKSRCSVMSLVLCCDLLVYTRLTERGGHVPRTEGPVERREASACERMTAHVSRDEGEAGVVDGASKERHSRADRDGDGLEEEPLAAVVQVKPGKADQSQWRDKKQQISAAPMRQAQL